MLTAINTTIYSTNFNRQVQPPLRCPYINYKTLNADTVSFSGKSPCELYKSVFDYMAAEIFDANKAFRIDGSMLNTKKIKSAVKVLFNENRAYPAYKESSVDKIKWKSYIPQDIRTNSINKINEARAVRMGEWKNFLENPDRMLFDGTHYNPELVKRIKENPSLRFIIWHSVTSELKANNRHIPVPFDEKALLETIKGFEQIAPKDRKVRCASLSFLEVYTHRLRDNLLMNLGLSGDKPVWVKIPSLAHDRASKDKNIAKLEILSCKNWCTRSSVDKAEDALEDGDFYIYIRRGKSELWEPVIGMTTLNGKIDQIQGVENNNIITLGLVDEVKKFISAKNLKCQSGVSDEGPKAYQAIMISDKLNETVPDVKPTYSFSKAIKENNTPAMFNFLKIPVTKLEDGMYEIGSYRPVYSLNPKSGISVPYSMFGINEDDLLKNVKIIRGNLTLAAKQTIFQSGISVFPPNLETVTGRVVCSAEQYKKFGADIERVVGGNKAKIIIHER